MPTRPKVDAPEPGEDQFLLPFERHIMTGQWKEYLKIKRQNWLATIQHFPDLWDLFITLDGIFSREIDDLQPRPSGKSAFAQMLFIKAHQTIRVAGETAFSTQITEAYDMTRAAIETAVIAHKIYREPILAKVFLARDDGKKESEAFKNAFERNKAMNLFPSKYPFLTGLHQYYSRFSDWGTHATLYSFVHHLVREEDAKVTNYKIKYVESDPEKISGVIFDVMGAFHSIEKAFHDAFSARLVLDTWLQDQRLQFDQRMSSAGLRLLKSRARHTGSRSL